MLPLKDIERIRLDYYGKKKSVAKIAREMNLSRTTVTKYLKPINLSQEPAKKKKHPNRVLLDQYRDIFISYLDEDAVNFRKQRHTATRMYERIMEEYPDFPCSKNSTIRYCGEVRKEYFATHYGYLPLEYEYGQAEVDFGDANFFIGEERIEGKYLCLTFPQSNATYMQLLKQKNAEAGAQALVKIFEYMGGVPHTIWFDNDTAFVVKRKVGKKMRKIKTDCYRRFNLQYKFKDVFLPPFSPGMKMDVEVAVKETRRKLLVPIPLIDDLDAYNEELLHRCAEYNNRKHPTSGGTVNDVHYGDTMKLNPLPPQPFVPCTVYAKRFDGYGRFALEKNNYYVDTAIAEKKMQVQVWPDHILIFTEEGEPYTRVPKIPRLVGEYQRWLNWPPYVRVLANKPAAILNFPFIDLFDDQEIRNWITALNRTQLKDFLNQVALAMETNGVDETVKDIKSILENYPAKKIIESEEGEMRRILKEEADERNQIVPVEVIEQDIADEKLNYKDAEWDTNVYNGIPEALEAENEIDDSAIVPEFDSLPKNKKIDPPGSGIESKNNQK